MLFPAPATRAISVKFIASSERSSTKWSLLRSVAVVHSTSDDLPSHSAEKDVSSIGRSDGSFTVMLFQIGTDIPQQLLSTSNFM